MEFLEYLNSHLTAVLITAVILYFWFAQRDIVITAIKWFCGIFTEPGDNGNAKPSFNRIAAGFLLWRIDAFVSTYLQLVKDKNADLEKLLPALTQVNVPQALMWLFMVCVGFSFMAKVFGPDVMSAVAQYFLGKVGVQSSPKG